MKRKIYVMALAVMGTAASVLYSCKQTDAMEPVTTVAKNLMGLRSGEQQLTVSNGWLSFRNQDSFNKTMALLHNQYEAGKLGSWEKGFAGKGFTSLRRQYEIIDADSSENRRAPTADSLISANKLLDCPDSWFATVLSKDGYIQIADTVYSFRPGQKDGAAYAVPARYAAQLIKGVMPLSLQGTKMHPTSFTQILFPRWPEPDPGVPSPSNPISDLPICDYPTGFMGNWWGQVGGDIYTADDYAPFPKHNGRKVKLNYHRWRVGYIFYASAGIRCKMLKHTRFAGWRSVTYADQMIMESCVKGKVFIPGLPLIGFNEQTSPGWPNFTRYAENKFEKTMKWTASGLFNEIILEHFNFHFFVNYRGYMVERYIRQ